jgi:predicted HicB family RNase H-like nuclease
MVRMNPEHAAAARQSARDAGKQVGQWLEEAITEKREREQGAEDVTKADC